MAVNVENGVLVMEGVKVGNEIMITDADYVSVFNKDTGKNEIAERVKVTLDKEILQQWIDEWGILDDLDIEY